MSPHRLTNPVRRYAWGSTTTIPGLLGVAADGEPQAELGLGALPDSPSTLPDGRILLDAVAAAPDELLGERLPPRAVRGCRSCSNEPRHPRLPDTPPVETAAPQE